MAGGGHGGGGGHVGAIGGGMHFHLHGVHHACHTAAHADKIGHVMHAHHHKHLRLDLLAWFLMNEMKKHHMSIPPSINALA